MPGLHAGTTCPRRGLPSTAKGRPAGRPLEPDAPGLGRGEDDALPSDLHDARPADGLGEVEREVGRAAGRDLERQHGHDGAARRLV